MQILQTEKSETEDSTPDAVCDYCHVRVAEIFQVTGDYCLDCWQQVTHTNA